VSQLRSLGSGGLIVVINGVGANAPAKSS